MARACSGSRVRANFNLRRPPETDDPCARSEVTLIPSKHEEAGVLYLHHVEYAERRLNYGILFLFSLFCEYSNFEYLWVLGMCRVHQAEYGIPILVAAEYGMHVLAAASQEYVTAYATRRFLFLYSLPLSAPRPAKP